MNRIQMRLATDTSNPPGNRDSILATLPGSVKRSFDNPSSFREPETALFFPQHYEKRYHYPLIVWLHSAGSDSGQLLTAMAKLSLRNYVGVAVNGLPCDHSGTLGWPESNRGIEAARQRIANAIDYAQLKASICSQRIILAGASDGGTMAFRLAFGWPQLVAGAMSFHGPLPSGHAPLSLWERCRKIPLFWSHSRHATDFGETNMCQQLQLLHAAGFDLTLRQYPTADPLPAKAFRDANCWIMEMIQSAVR